MTKTLFTDNLNIFGLLMGTTPVDSGSNAQDAYNNAVSADQQGAQGSSSSSSSSQTSSADADPTEPPPPQNNDTPDTPPNSSSNSSYDFPDYDANNNNTTQQKQDTPELNKQYQEALKADRDKSRQESQLLERMQVYIKDTRNSYELQRAVTQAEQLVRTATKNEAQKNLEAKQEKSKHEEKKDELKEKYPLLNKTDTQRMLSKVYKMARARNKEMVEEGSTSKMKGEEVNKKLNELAEKNAMRTDKMMSEEGDEEKSTLNKFNQLIMSANKQGKAKEKPLTPQEKADKIKQFIDDGGELIEGEQEMTEADRGKAKQQLHGELKRAKTGTDKEPTIQDLKKAEKMRAAKMGKEQAKAEAADKNDLPRPDKEKQIASMALALAGKDKLGKKELADNPALKAKYEKAAATQLAGAKSVHRGEDKMKDTKSQGSLRARQWNVKSAKIFGGLSWELDDAKNMDELVFSFTGEYEAGHKDLSHLKTVAKDVGARKHESRQFAKLERGGTQIKASREGDLDTPEVRANYFRHRQKAKAQIEKKGHTRASKLQSVKDRDFKPS